MKDSYNRDINYVRISVTDRCNLRCFYCMPDGITKVSHDEILRDEEIINIVTEATSVGITKIRITGGDPLVRKGIYELVAKIRAIPGVKEVVMTTNGTLLLGNVTKLKQAGVSRVNFSLDTMNDTLYKQITNSDKMLDYEALIQELKDNELLPIKINVVLLRGINDSEIPNFIELANKHDVLIRFIELMPVGDLDYDYKNYFIGKDEILSKYPSLVLSHKENTCEYYMVEGKSGRIGFITPITHDFCSTCNRIRLTSEGYIKPCLLNDEEIYVKTSDSKELLEKIQNAIKGKQEKQSSSSKTPMNKIGG